MPLPSETCASTRDLPARRWLVGSLFLFYFALLAEGVLRKWVVPGASNALVFLRDPIELLVVAFYAWHRPAPGTRLLLGGFFAVGLALLLCAGCQALTSNVGGLVQIVGLRNYLFFVPICFAVRDSFTAEDYGRWIRLNLMLAGPVAALVVAQYFSLPSALLNTAPGGSNEGVFLLVEGVVRPYGVFSFALGHSAFAAWMIGTVLAATLARTAFGLGTPMLAVGAAAVAVMGVLSGSRTYFLLAGATILLFVVSAALFGPPRAKALGLVMGAAMALAGAIVLLAVPSLASNLLERQTTAVASEGATLDRLETVATDFLREADRVPLFGLGLGAGTNVANFLNNGRTDHVLAEYELTRVVQELGPVFGLFYIAVRWALLAWFVALTLREARRGNLQPACFIGFLTPVFLAHDITLQNTMIGIGWFAAGVFLAAVEVGSTLTSETAENRQLRPEHVVGAVP